MDLECCDMNEYAGEANSLDWHGRHAEESRQAIKRIETR
jgi:hypothetical protein